MTEEEKGQENPEYTEEQKEVLAEFAFSIDSEGLWYAIDPGGYINAEDAEEVGLTDLAEKIRQFKKLGNELESIINPFFDD